MKEDANLTISDDDRRSARDGLDGMCEYPQSEYVLDAFFSVFGGKFFYPDLKIRERMGREVGELGPCISDDGVLYHRISSHDIMTNYCECSGRLRVFGKLSSTFCLTQERLAFSC